MDIDVDVARWLLDFLTRQPLEDRTMTALIRALPIPTDDLNLQKLLLLRKLGSDESRRSITESTLELLEQLEEIESRRGNEASDVMKRAYCLAAVECTLRLPVNGEGGDGKATIDIFEISNELRVGSTDRMERVLRETSLGSDLLQDWKLDIEAAVWDDNACERVLQDFERVRAVDAVREYLREERERMGPSFIELVSESVEREDGLQKLLRDHGMDTVAEVEMHSPLVDQAPNGSAVRKETPKGKIKLRDKLVGLRRLRKMASAKSRGARIDGDGSDQAEPSNARYNIPGSVEVNKAREALDKSSMELRAVVNDPLPEALRVAEAIAKLQQEAEGANLQKEAEGANLQKEAEGAKLQKEAEGNNGGPEKVPKPSLMERNSTARTFEWDESVDGSPEDIACRAELRLPSPKKIKTSPLKVYEFKSIKPRRVPRKWSAEEEDALREGVEKYGRSWKAILQVYRNKFDRRTDVDLKDKWRNMTK